jgi:hypothetical protein
VVCTGDRRDAYRVLVGIPNGKRSLGRCRHRWEDNIEMDLQIVGCQGAQDRNRWQALVNVVVNLHVP